ncbi:MAG: GNAT family N-acetyltransferase [Terriglobales bacterium]
MVATIEVLTADELFALAEEPCNSDLFGKDGESRRIMYLYADYAQKETHVTALLDKRVVAIGALEQNPNNASELWVKFIAVEESHQGEGLGGMIVERIFQYALEHGKSLHPSTFQPMGRERLLHKFRVFAAQHPQSICHCWHCQEQLGQCSTPASTPTAAK